MLMIRPVAVTQGVLAYTNAADVEADWNGGTTYAESDAVGRFVAGQRRRFVSAAGGNTNHDPATDDGTWWTDDGPTNAWAAFDGAIQSQTLTEDMWTAVLQIPAEDIVDVVYLANLNGVAAQVTVEDAVEGVVFDEAYELVSTTGIADWWSFYFEPPRRLRELLVQGLGQYAGATVTVSVAAYGELVGVGACIPGFSRRLGGTMWAPRLGIRDYSPKVEDDFGNLVVVERAYRKKAAFTVVVETTYLDDVIERLTDYRARPVLFVGSPTYAAMAVYGFYTDFEMVAQGRRVSYLSLNLEGLT